MSFVAYLAFSASTSDISPCSLEKKNYGEGGECEDFKPMWQNGCWRLHRKNLLAFQTKLDCDPNASDAPVTRGMKDLEHSLRMMFRGAPGAVFRSFKSNLPVTMQLPPSAI